MELVRDDGEKFTIEVEMDGRQVTLDVQAIDEFFRVTMDGEVLTDAFPNEMWYQMNNPLIDDDLFNRITTAIDHHYD